MDIFKLCCSDNIAELKSYLETNPLVDINQKNENGHTPLQVSILSYNPCQEIIKLLLEKGADPNLVDENGNTIIQQICLMNTKYSEKILETILNNSEIINVSHLNKENKTALEICLQQYNVSEKKVEALLKYRNKGANYQASQFTPGITSINLKRQSHKIIDQFFNLKKSNLIELLIKYGQNIDYGYLFNSYIEKNIDISREILNLLTEKKIDINLKNKFGKNSFDLWIKSKQNIDILKFILSENKKVISQNNNKYTDNQPSFLEKYLCQSESISIEALSEILNLTDKRYLNIQFANGETALTQICKLAYTKAGEHRKKTDIENASELVKLCIKHGASPNTPNKFNETPLYILGNYISMEPIYKKNHINKSL